MPTFISPEWVSAVGALLAVGAAIYFGFFGNRSFWEIIKQHEKITDKKAFEYLTSLPENLVPEYSKKAKNEFEKFILFDSQISDKKVKKYKNYIDLVENFRKSYNEKNPTKRNKSYFKKIKKEAGNLKIVVDEDTWRESMQSLYWYEATFFWNRSVVEVQLPPISTSFSIFELPVILLYFDYSKDKEKKFLKNAYEIINGDLELKEKVIRKGRRFGESTFLFPGKQGKYKLLSPFYNCTDDKIEIEYKKFQINLVYGKPYYLD